MSFIQSLGIIQYPLWIVLILTLIQTVRCTAALVRREDAGSPLRSHSVLVLGALGACLGILGSLIGVRVTAGAIVDAGQVSAAVAWEAMGLAVGPSIFGFFLLGLAAVAWLALQYAAGRASR
ncbi:MAG: hypothetical protein OXH49_12115 [Gemmatimonadetes bacterium]|nr:hypothetical protein [Gemmatimonadota bacterium]